jgi:hypothetical protein
MQNRMLVYDYCDPAEERLREVYAPFFDAGREPSD